MILASHAIIGAAVGRLFPSSPLSGFIAGLLSHYAMDAIPHWDYTLPSIFERKKSGAGRVPGREVAYAGIDFIIGILLSFAIFPTGLGNPGTLSFLSGIIGGVLPDALQFFYLFYKGEPIHSHQKFHNAVHARWHLKNRPRIGIPLQTAIVILFVAISKFYSK